MDARAQAHAPKPATPLLLSAHRLPHLVRLGLDPALSKVVQGEDAFFGRYRLNPRPPKRLRAHLVHQWRAVGFAPRRRRLGVSFGAPSGLFRPYRNASTRNFGRLSMRSTENDGERRKNVNGASWTRRSWHWLCWSPQPHPSRSAYE